MSSTTVLTLCSTGMMLHFPSRFIFCLLSPSFYSYWHHLIALSTSLSPPLSSLSLPLPLSPSPSHLPSSSLRSVLGNPTGGRKQAGETRGRNETTSQF